MFGAGCTPEPLAPCAASSGAEADRAATRPGAKACSTGKRRDGDGDGIHYRLGGGCTDRQPAVR